MRSLVFGVVIAIKCHSLSTLQLQPHSSAIKGPVQSPHFVAVALAITCHSLSNRYMHFLLPITDAIPEQEVPALPSVDQVSKQGRMRQL